MRTTSGDGLSPTTVVLVGTAVGAVVGFGAGAGAYSLLAAALERAGGALGELQGFAWDLVPVGTVGGGALGWWTADRWTRRRPE